VKAPTGAVVVFGLDGTIRQVVAGLECANTVDVEYGLVVQGQKGDSAMVTERLKTRLRAVRIASWTRWAGSGRCGVPERLRRPRIMAP